MSTNKETGNYSEYFQNLDYVLNVKHFTENHAENRLKQIGNNVALNEISASLEVGCGAGVLSRYLNGWVGIDISRTGIKLCAPFPSFVASADALPFRDSIFDLVVSFDTLEHLPHPEKSINEWLRACKPGGVVFVSSPPLIHRVLLKDWLRLEQEGLAAHFTWRSLRVLKIVVKSLPAILSELLYRLSDEIKLKLRMRINFRAASLPVNYVYRENPPTNDLDACYVSILII